MSASTVKVASTHFDAPANDTDGLLLYLHDMAMSKNPIEAATGRALKATMPAAFHWLQEEAGRGVTSNVFGSAVAGMAASLVVSLADSAGATPKTLESLADMVHAAICDGANKLRGTGA